MELIQACVRAVLLELSQDAIRLRRGNAQNLFVGSRIQIDWNKHILLEARYFGLIPVLPHLAVKNGEALIGSVLLELTQNAIGLRRGNAEDLVIGCCIQIGMNKNSAVQLRQLSLGESRRQCCGKLGDVGKRTLV